MADQQGAPWVCPWGICNHQQAQECRAEKHPRKGCGGRFPPGTTLEEAKRQIGPPTRGVAPCATGGQWGRCERPECLEMRRCAAGGAPTAPTLLRQAIEELEWWHKEYGTPNGTEVIDALRAAAGVMASEPTPAMQQAGVAELRSGRHDLALSTYSAVAAVWRAMEAARGVMASDAARVQRLRDALEGECDGLAIDERHARAILEYVDGVIACSFPDCNCPPDAEGDVHCPNPVPGTDTSKEQS